MITAEKIELQSGQSKTIVLDAVGVSKNMQFVVHDNAQLTVINIRSLKDSMNVAHHITAMCHKDSTFNYYSHVTGDGQYTANLDMQLIGTGATAQVRCAHALTNNGRVHVTSQQNHVASYTTSDVLIKGIVRDTAHDTYHGTIRIEQDAAHTTADQQSKHLMLSPTAYAQSIPILEVLNHDVQCGHGSAIGQIDSEQLFYAQSRGLSNSAAQNMILQAFFADVLLNIKHV